jgi:hypothetical protein
MAIRQPMEEEKVRTEVKDAGSESIKLEKDSILTECSPIKIVDSSAMLSDTQCRSEHHNKSLQVSDSEQMLEPVNTSHCNKTQIVNSKASKKKNKRASQTVNKKVKFFIKFKLGKKQYEIDFKYDMEEDNPAMIAQEMREMLTLPPEKVNAIQH